MENKTNDDFSISKGEQNMKELRFLEELVQRYPVLEPVKGDILKAYELIRDCYENVVKLDFDGIGLDFIEGRKTIELVEKYGFPNDKVLFAGLVNGKNIWKNNYKKTLETVYGLKKCRNQCCYRYILFTSSCTVHT